MDNSIIKSGSPRSYAAELTRSRAYQYLTTPALEDTDNSYSRIPFWENITRPYNILSNSFENYTLQRTTSNNNISRTINTRKTRRTMANYTTKINIGFLGRDYSVKNSSHHSPPPEPQKRVPTVIQSVKNQKKMTRKPGYRRKVKPQPDRCYTNPPQQDQKSFQPSHERQPFSILAMYLQKIKHQLTNEPQSAMLYKTKRRKEQEKREKVIMNMTMAQTKSTSSSNTKRETVYVPRPGARRMGIKNPFEKFYNTLESTKMNECIRKILKSYEFLKEFNFTDNEILKIVIQCRPTPLASRIIMRNRFQSPLQQKTSLEHVGDYGQIVNTIKDLFFKEAKTFDILKEHLLDYQDKLERLVLEKITHRITQAERAVECAKELRNSGSYRNTTGYYQEQARVRTEPLKISLDVLNRIEGKYGRCEKISNLHRRIFQRLNTRYQYDQAIDQIQ